MFRGKFISQLRTAYDQGKLNFSRSLKDFSHPVYFQNFIEQIQNKNWVVYSKAPFGGPEKVLSYLGRYTHRIAISNHRITNVTDDDVSFSYRDRRDNNTAKNITVSGEEFIRRFLLHSIPKGFTRIRHYGILASRKKQIALAACRKSLGVVAEKIDKKPPKPTLELLREISGIDILKCPECKIGKMIEERKIKKLRFRMPINHKIHGNTC